MDLEIQLRELACQSLMEARNEIDALEAEKALLASDQRVNCYASRLEQQRKQMASSSLRHSCSSSSSMAKNNGGHSTNGTWRTDWQSISSQKQQQQQPPSRTPLETVDHAFNQYAQTADEGRESATTGAQSTSGSDSVGRRGSRGRECEESLNGFHYKAAQQACSKEAPSSPKAAPKISDRSTSVGRTASRCRTNPLKHQQAQLRHQSPSPADKNALTANSSNNNNNTPAHLTRPSRGLNEKRRAKMVLNQQIARASNINCNIVSNNRAMVSLSELRIPLMWRDVDHFKGRGDYRRYAIFCLLKIDSQIHDTQLITNVDRQMIDVNFDDTIVFHDVEHDFELTLEIYSCVYLEEFSLKSTPRKLKEKLSNSVGRAMGRRLTSQTASVNYTRELDAYQEKGYRFTMIASANLRLDDAKGCVKTYDLVLPGAENRNNLGAYTHCSAASTNMTISRARQRDQSQPAWSPWNNPGLSGGTLKSSAQSNPQSTNVSTSNLRDLHRNNLPLFGLFCCKLSVKPDIFDKCVKTGYLCVADIHMPISPSDHSHDQKRASVSTSGSPTSSNGATSTSPDSAASTTTHSTSPSHSPESTLMLRSALAASSKLATMALQSARVYWALLRNFSLHLWPVDESKLENSIRRNQAPQVDISRRPPFIISIDRHTRLLRVSNSSLTIETDQGCFVFSVFDPFAAFKTANDYKFIDQRHHNPQKQQSQDDIAHWLRPIEQLIYDSHIWASVLNHHHPTQRKLASGLVVVPNTQQQKRMSAQL